MKERKSAGILFVVLLVVTVLSTSSYFLVDFRANVALAQGDFYVYPSKGQSKEQQEKDRFECEEWASKETGFDPMKPFEMEPEPEFKGGPIKKSKAKKAWEEEQEQKKAAYHRQQEEFESALKTCIKGRGYTVSK